jgi:hypothetical protein
MDRKKLYDKFFGETLRNIFSSKKNKSIGYFTQKAEQKRIKVKKRRRKNKLANESRKKNR